MHNFKTNIIEFFGLPQAGKTTTANTLVEYLNKEGLLTTLVEERASLCPIDNKLDSAFNFWTSISFLKEYIEANEKGVDLLIADRGIIDAYVWLNMFAKRDNDSTLLKFLLQITEEKLLRKQFKVAFFFKADIDIILSRHKVTKDSHSKERIMNEGVLIEYYNSYKEIKSKLEGICTIIEIDSSFKNSSEVIEDVKKFLPL